MKFLFNYKLYENVQQAKSILKSLNIPETDSDFQSLKNMLKGHEGYLGWFTKMMFTKNVPYDELNTLYNDIKTTPEIINSLPKSVISYDNWEELMDDRIRSHENIKLRRILNQFPSTQKDFFNLNKLSISDKSLLISLYDLSDRKNFIRKISRYRTKSDLVSSLKSFVKGDRTSGFNDILEKVKKSKAKIFIEDKDNDIIICEVDYDQIRYLASDTSWCIIPSKSTFDSYTNGFNRQFIIFLTDETGNYSKIGVTYGFNYRTAHLKNDSHLSQNELSKILTDRGVDLSIISQNKETLLKDIRTLNKTSVQTLINGGFTREEILKNKQSFTSDDLKLFNEDEIVEYNLSEKSPLTNRIVQSHDIFWFMKNINRYVDKLDVDTLCKLKPSPNILETLIERDSLSKECMEWVSMLKQYKSTVKDNAWRFYSYYVTNHRGRSESKDSFESLVYGLMYCGVTSDNYTLSDLIKMLPNRDMRTYYVDGLLEYLQWANFDLKSDIDTTFNLFVMFARPRTFGTTEEEILKILSKVPILKDKFKEVIEKSIKSSKYYDSDLKIIKKYYPDLYKEIKYYNTLNKTYEEWKKMIPKATVQNYDLRSIGELLTPQQFYDKFWSVLKDWNWGSGYGYSTDSVFYMINILCKTNNYDKISELKVYWNQSFTGKVIRSALGMLNYNGKNVIYETFQLNEEEKEKLFNYLQTHIKDKIYYNVSNHSVDIEMERYKVFSLVYYLYGWGFNTYLRLVENSKNVYKEIKEDTPKGTMYSKVRIRINYLEHVLNYLAKNKIYDELDSLLSTVMGWKMTKTELKMSQEYIERLDYIGDTKDREDLRKVLFKYLRSDQIKELQYPRSNRW